MWRGYRSCDAILFMVKKPPEAKYAVILEPPRTLMIVTPTVKIFGRPWILYSVAFFLYFCPLELRFLFLVRP